MGKNLLGILKNLQQRVKVGPLLSKFIDKFIFEFLNLVSSFALKFDI
jgi:hypothetical protein